MSFETKIVDQAILYAQTDVGSLVSGIALAKIVSGTYQGRTVTELAYRAANRGPWNIEKAVFPLRNGTGSMHVRVTGIVSGCRVRETSGTNNVAVGAGIYNCNGTRVALLSEDGSNAITRGATGKWAVTAVHGNASGTIAVTKGTDGDALDLTGGYGGAGQKPLVAVTECVLGYVATYGDSVAVIPQADIYAGDNANISYEFDPLRSGIVLGSVLEKNRTGGIERTIYASFYDITNAIVPVAKLEDVKMVIRRDAPIETPYHGTNFKKYSRNPGISWSVSSKKWRVDDFWMGKMLDPFADNFYIRLVEDYGDDKYLHGFGMLMGDYNVNPKRGPVSEEIQLQGNGELVAA